MGCNHELGHEVDEYIITLYQGDDWSQQLDFTDADDAPINLTGSTFEARATKSGETTINLTVSVNNAAGTATLTLTDSQTSAMRAGAAKNDLDSRWRIYCKWTDASGYTRKIFGATLYLLQV